MIKTHPLALQDDIVIDPEFEKLSPPLCADEIRGLEESLRVEGNRDPIVVWRGHNILLDGHHRREICRRLGKPLKPPVEIDLPSRDHAKVWITEKHLARRNLSDDQRAILWDDVREARSKLERIERARSGGQAGGRGRPKDSLSTDAGDKLSHPKRDTRAEITKGSVLSRRKLDYAAQLRREAPDLRRKVLMHEMTLVEAVREKNHRRIAALSDPPVSSRAGNLRRLRQKWETESGQVWESGTHRLACGDSTDPTLVARLFAGVPPKTIRMVLTDAPYGVNYAAKNDFLNRDGQNDRVEKPIVGDDQGPEKAAQILAAALDIVTDYYMVGATIYAFAPSGPGRRWFEDALASGGFTFRQELVWNKGRLVPGRMDYKQGHEVILYGWRKGQHFFIADHSQTTVFDAKRQVNDTHPVSKPVELIARMIANSTKTGELIYDPFVGSGTTLVAAEQLGRTGFGVEIDPEYVAAALERLAKLGLTPRLWQNDAEPRQANFNPASTDCFSA